MKYLLGFLILLILVLIQVSLLPLLAVRGVWPNLLLVYLLSLSFVRRVRTALISAIFGGVLLDLTRGSLFGLSSLLFVLIFTLSTFFVRRLRFKHLQISLFTFFASILLRGIEAFPHFNMNLTLLGAFFDSLLIMLVYPVINWAIENLFPRKDLQLSFKDIL